MDPIARQSFDSLGYNFIPKQFLPEGKDEYHLRNLQNRSGITYRSLTAYEIQVYGRALQKYIQKQDLHANWCHTL